MKRIIEYISYFQNIMKELEKNGWTSKHQNTTLDVEDLDIKQILNVEVEETPNKGRKVRVLSISKLYQISFSRRESMLR